MKKYVCLGFSFGQIVDYQTCYTKKDALKISDTRYNCCGKVMTIKQAEKKYPNLKCYD